MKESYSDDIMLCFVQGFGNNSDHHGCQNAEYTEGDLDNTSRGSKKKQSVKKVSLKVDVQELNQEENVEVELRPKKKARELLTGKSLRLSSGDRFLDVKRSFSDRFSLVNVNDKRPRSLLTIRKTWSTGNFAAGASAGGCGGPRSAPATPIQLEPTQAKPMKHEKQAVKPLSSSAPSVRPPPAGAPTGGGVSDASEGKTPSKARQKKFLRHFPQVGPEERVLNYYSCALVGDILLQGHLYITKNYFAFYSNVFGYVTKLLIPTSSVLRVTKEKMARIIPNAVGVCTRDERHVFGSLLSRDATHRLMTRVWKQARHDTPAAPPPQELPISEAELDGSEYSPDESSSAGGGDATDGPRGRARTPLCRDPDREQAIVSGPGAAVIQPALLTGALTAPPARPRGGLARAVLIGAALLLAVSALWLANRLYETTYHPEDELAKLSGSELYSELVRWRARLHGRAATELQAFLSTNLLLLTKVRQSLEALSGVILTDMGQAGADAAVNIDVPNETAFS